MKKPARAGFQQRISGNLAVRRASPADLTSLSARFAGSLRVVLEVPAAYTATFPTGFGSPLRIFRKIAGTTTTY